MEKEDLDKIRKSRLEGLTDTAEYYLHCFANRGMLSEEQIKDAEDVRDTIGWFGEIGIQWAEMLDEIIEKSKITQNGKDHNKDIRSNLSRIQENEEEASRCGAFVQSR